MRTIFYHLVLLIIFIFQLFFRYPYIILQNRKKRYELTYKYSHRMSKICFWATGSKVKLIYKNNSKKMIEEIKENNDTFIIMSNHQSNIDIPLLLGHIPLVFTFVAKKEMKTWPIISTWMKALNCIFLDRENPRQGIVDIKQAIHEVKDGYSYVIFPEGSRSFHGEIGDFKKGSFKLVTDTGAKLIPVTIIGTIDVQQRSSLKISANKNVKIVIDEPINYSDLENEEKKHISEKVRSIVEKNYLEYV